MAGVHSQARLSAARLRSRIRFLLAIGAVAVAVVGLLRWTEVRRATRASHPPLEGALVVAGVEDEISIARDRRGVPHVRAGNEHDLWFALGFVHAQDRLAQMVWLRRVASGRTAEWIGAAGLPSDREARTLDLVGAARRDLVAQTPLVRRALDAYAAGVNARIARIREREEGAPLSLLEPIAAVDPWSPADSLALLKLVAWSYGSGLDEMIVLEEIVRRLGAAAARPFFPTGVGPAALPPVPEPGAGEAPSAAPASAQRLRDAPLRVQAALRRAAGLAGASIGSSAFVVAGHLAASGRPLLAADAHLPPTFPAHLHAVDLRAGSLRAAGATLPGIPAVWTGFNGRVAWASTGAAAIVADLVEETLHENDPARYAEGSGWRTLTIREEEIRQRDGEPERLLVRATARGPLVDGLIPGADRPLALRWTGGLPGGGLDGLLRVARAHDAAQLLAALELHREPVLAVAFADESGAGGLQLAGALPRRRMAAGLQPVPARNPAFAWSEMLPASELPGRRLGAGVEWLVAADRPLPSRGAGIEYFWQAGDRARRIDTLVAEARRAGPLEPTSVARLLVDRASGGAEPLLALVFEHSGDMGAAGREEREVLERLQAWDRSADRRSAGAAVYHAFLSQLLRALFTPALGEELLARYLALPRIAGGDLARAALVAAAAGGVPEQPWTDPEFVQRAVRESLRATWLSLTVELGTNPERWAWGRLAEVEFAPLWPRAFRGRSARLGPFAYGGDAGSVALAEHPPLGPYAARAVSTWRFVADTADLDQALTVLAPGQSEHAGLPNATDGLARWLDDRFSLLSTSDPVIEDSPVQRLVLLPRD